MGGAQGAVSLGAAIGALVLQSAVVPVDGDGVGATDRGLLDAQVVTATTGERRRAARAATQGVVEDHSAVGLVLVGRGVGGLNVQVGGRDGLGHGDERAQLEERELHDENEILRDLELEGMSIQINAAATTGDASINGRQRPKGRRR